MRPSLIPSFLCLSLVFSFARPFSVKLGSPPNECGSLSVSWVGGSPPFAITVVPIYNIPRNVSIPSSAFNDNQGSYTISPFSLTNGTQFLLTMSDATGFGTGGTSELLTVGELVGSPACDTSNPTLPFSYSLPSSLQQCSPYIFDGYDEATLPVTITGFIPGGDLFLLHPQTGTSFTWRADVSAGTTLVFIMTDAKGNSGGSSYSEVVAPSNNASCLNQNSPSSTMSATPSTATGSSTSSPTQSSPSSVSSGTIIGAAVGAPLATAAIVALAVCYLKRQRRHNRSQYGLAPTRNSRRSNSVEAELDPGAGFQHPPIYPFPYQTDSVSRLAPPINPSLASYQGASSTSPLAYASETPHTLHHSRSNSNTDSFTTFGGVASSTMSSNVGRKAAMAGVSSYKPTRFIVHTDAEDTVEAEPEVVELPPQYSERQTHAVTHTRVSSVSGLSTDLVYLSGQYTNEPPQTLPHRLPE